MKSKKYQPPPSTGEIKHCHYCNGDRPNENLPRISENRQSIINAASAALRRNRK